MDIDKLILFVSGLGALVVVVFGFALLVAKFYRKVEQGRALIINKVTKRPDVTFTGGLVLPIIHRAEEMDISVKTIEVDRRGKEGLICHDNIRADIKVTFFVKVNRKEESVLKVAQQVGCKRASDQATIEELFMAKFSEAVKTVGKGLDFVELYTNRDGFRDAIRAHIGNEEDLNGYILDDVAIDFLEQTPIESLDPENILDAQGIRKITELTTAQNIQTNNFRQDERKAIKKKNVEAEEALLELNRQEADAKAKQQREIDVMVAREKATTEVEQAEQFQRARRARIKAEEDVEVAEQDKARQVEIAEKARERAIAIENERVEKDRALEAISREREVELQTINKDKEVEVEKKSIADVVRSRIAVERTVAEEEENIKDLRATSEANRNKDVAVTAAEAEAEEGLVKEIKAAEAKQEVAKFSAREQLTLADAELEAADRQAKAKIRLAEGTQAEEAAEGLARVRVRESEALAIEKEGQANAQVVQLKMEAEAAGLRQKAEAMEALRGAAKDHEEFRLRLETDRDIRFKRMETEQVIARDRAEILKDAFEQAKINIVGGDGRFFDKFINAIAVGQSVDGTLDNSETIRKLMDGYLEGDGNLPKDVLTALNGGGASNVQALTISAFLTQLMGSADEPMKEKLRKLMAEAQALGIGAGHGDGAN